MSQKLSNSSDNRVSGIEVQFEGSLDLRGRAQAVVLPGPLIDSPEVRRQLSTLKIEPLPYRQIDRMKPSEYVNTIFDTCYQYYREIGLIA